MTAEVPKKNDTGRLLALLAVVVALGIGVSMFINPGKPHSESAHLNKRFPPIKTIFWTNGSAPTPEELSDHVLVFNAWATFCDDCPKTTPLLLDLYEKFKDRGVIMIGLTSEGARPDTAKLAVKYIEEQKIPWRNALGAFLTLSELNPKSLPQLWVVDRQRRIVFHEEEWGPNAAKEIERAIVKALNAPPEKN